jgi:hypothetical protein
MIHHKGWAKRGRAISLREPSPLSKARAQVVSALRVSVNYRGRYYLTASQLQSAYDANERKHGMSNSCDRHNWSVWSAFVWLGWPMKRRRCFGCGAVEMHYDDEDEL